MKGQQKSPDTEGDVSVMEEGAVATADDPSAITIQSAAFSTDQPIKYLFKTEGAGGQVTYRVIHVADGTGVDAQADATGAVSVVTGFPTVTQAVTPAVTQAVLAQAEGLDGEAAETHYYYPATIANTPSATMVTNVQAPDSLLTQNTPTGQLYVMMSPQDVLSTTTTQSKAETPRTSRDDKRRAQHNEVERRRRDKINNWIVQLSKTIPDCSVDSTKNGQSKGGILSKACDYIQELRQSNARLGEEMDSLERLRMDNQLLRQEVEEWKSKNQILRGQLRQHGIVAASVEPQ
ncbi:upstream stimulatory factor 1-like isoform X2 [Engraulis encrasicolus]|uniref:upstream stimulatory factor 1-like isoform X2 n=1 Tax=Engraulis encrasicolus TaxID=184585 RepID=UPI002FCFDB95